MSGEPARPDPDALLQRVEQESRQKRGRLRLFLGFAPGVGKTYRMLTLAREAARQGRGIVVGLAETHGRADTEALLSGLDVLPRRTHIHRGQEIAEFDIDRVLSLKPEIAVVDELAHSNAPGSRHGKRFQDVEELLEAGIDVWTTANVQHIESLVDIVEQITGVIVRETIPDRIIDAATEIEVVDLPPEKLLDRLREGKVYAPPQANRAERNFFRLGNLMALRELALRRTAEHVDADVRAYREGHAIGDTWPATERILVCAGPAPGSATVIRAARRLAAGLRVPWAAIYVESPVAPLSEKDRSSLEGHLRLAESLGGEIVRISSNGVADAILAHARRRNVTRILVGKPTHPRWRDRLRGSLLDALVRSSGDIDVHVVSSDSERPRERRPAPRRRKAGVWREAALTVGIVACATAVAWVAQSIGLPDVEMVFIVGIMATAAAWGRRASILAAALSVAAFDFFFVPPYLTLAIADRRHALTFALMFALGLVISSLVSRLKAQEEWARLREERTRAFYSLARDLGSDVDEGQAALTFARHVAETCDAKVEVWKRDQVLARIPEDYVRSPNEEAVARWVFENGRPAGRGTDTLPESAALSMPLRHGGVTYAVAIVEPMEDEALEGERAATLDGLIRLGAMALARARLAADARASLLRARTEETRSALLSGVSHDLRTPLAAIMGAATTLRDRSAVLDDAQRADLVEAICDETARLDRLATNLLDMTRLQAGPLRLNREWVPLEEVLGTALERTERIASGHPVSVAVPEDFPLVSADPILLGQVFVNLIENAAKYTPPGTQIAIRAHATADRLTIDVSDSGPGIAPADRERVFEKFQRGPDAKAQGFGLGLPICRGIVEAHDGTLVLESSERGALFRISLPRLAPPQMREGGAA